MGNVVWPYCILLILNGKRILNGWFDLTKNQLFSLHITDTRMYGVCVALINIIINNQNNKMIHNSCGCGCGGFIGLHLSTMSPIH